MGARDFADDAGFLLLLFMGYKAYRAVADLDPRGPPFWKPEQTDKGGRGAGRGATTVPVPQGATEMWAEDTMRMFVREMDRAGIIPNVVLLGIAAASHFNADEVMGNNVGLLLVSRDDLRQVGYVEPPPFEQRDAVFQIPWIAKVIAYRIADAGGVAPDNVGDLAVLLHPSNPTIAPYIRNEANRRAHDADGTMLYIHHEQLLQHVLANP